MRDIAILFIILPLLSLAQSANFVRDGEDPNQEIKDEVQDSRNHLLIQEDDEIGIGMGRSIAGRGAAIGNQEEAAGSQKPPPLPILLQAAGAGQHLVSVLKFENLDKPVKISLALFQIHTRQLYFLYKRDIVCL